MTGAVVIRLSYWPDGADKDQVLDIAPRTVLQWEKEYRNRSATLLDNDAVKFEYLYEVAWIALGKPGGDFDKFCQTSDVAFAAAKEQPTAEESSVDPTSLEATITTS